MSRKIIIYLLSVSLVVMLIALRSFIRFDNGKKVAEDSMTGNIMEETISEK